MKAILKKKEEIDISGVFKFERIFFLRRKETEKLNPQIRIN